MNILSIDVGIKHLAYCAWHIYALYIQNREGASREQRERGHDIGDR